jgi:hypothetical protein
LRITSTQKNGEGVARAPIRREETMLATGLSRTVTAAPRTELAVKIASRPREIQEALGLVYQAYRRCGLIEPNPYRMRVTPYHLLETSEIFVGVVRGEVACTLTLVRDGELGLPMESIYGEEVAWRRAQGASLAEVSCLADRRHDLVRSLSVLVKVMGFMAQSATRRGVDELLIAVHPRHAEFYERFIGFEIIGGERAYETVCNKPAVALALDLNRLAVIHPRAYKRFFGLRFPEEALQYRPISDEFRAELSMMVDESYVAEPYSDDPSYLSEAHELVA